MTAAQNLRVLNEAQAQAAMQTQLSNSLVQIKIAENEAEAQLARARKQAEQVVVIAEAESQSQILAGRGEGARILQEGLSEASVLVRKIQSFSDPRLYALSVVAQNLATALSLWFPNESSSPGRGTAGSGGDGQAGMGAGAGHGLVGLLLSLLVAEKSGFQLTDDRARPNCRHSATRSHGKRWMRSSKPWNPTKCLAAPGQRSDAGGRCHDDRW